MILRIFITFKLYLRKLLFFQFISIWRPLDFILVILYSLWNLLLLSCCLKQPRSQPRSPIFMWTRLAISSEIYKFIYIYIYIYIRRRSPRSTTTYSLDGIISNADVRSDGAGRSGLHMILQIGYYNKIIDTVITLPLLPLFWLFH